MEKCGDAEESKLASKHTGLKNKSDLKTNRASVILLHYVMSR